MIQIGQRPDAGFDEPLRMLSDCHRRIERFLTALESVAPTPQLTAASRDTLTAALHYFAVSGPLHTADEDESLFPRLRAADPGWATALDSLDEDHAAAALGHAQIAALGQRWLEQGALIPEERAAFTDAVARLQTLYQDHIRVEDTFVFPRAAQMLPLATLAAVGREMAARRGLTL